MIDLVKDALLKAIGSTVVNKTTLSTVFCEVADIVNSRPLTYLSPDEILDVLTPNTFLRPDASALDANININPETLSSSTSRLLTGYKQVWTIKEHYKSQFYSHYLQLMREKHARLHPTPQGAVKYKPKVGEIVLVKNADTSRAKWPLGVIESLDRRQAYASVRIIDWTTTLKRTEEQLRDNAKLYATKIVRRSINTLYPLELPPEEPRTMDVEAPEAKLARRLSTLNIEVDAGPATPSS